MNAADIVFLCLPDAAAKESVSLCENERVRININIMMGAEGEVFAHVRPLSDPAFHLVVIHQIQQLLE